MKRFDASIPLLRIRLVDRLRSAGGSMLRNELREAIRSDLTAAEFERLVQPLAERGELVCEQVRRRCTCYDGRWFERRCTLYRLTSKR